MKKPHFIILLLLILIITIISSFIVAKNLRQTASQNSSTTTQAQKPSPNPIKRVAKVLGVWVGGEPEPSPTPSPSTVAAKSDAAAISPASSPTTSPTSTNLPASSPTSTPSPNSSASSSSPIPTPTTIPTPNPATFDLQLESVVLSSNAYAEEKNLKGNIQLQNNGTYVFDKPVHPYALTVYAKNLSPTTAANVTYTVMIDDEPTTTTKDLIGAGKSYGERVVELPKDTKQHTVKVQVGTLAYTAETNSNNNSLKFIYKIKN